MEEGWDTRGVRGEWKCVEEGIRVHASHFPLCFVYSCICVYSGCGLLSCYFSGSALVVRVAWGMSTYDGWCC